LLSDTKLRDVLRRLDLEKEIRWVETKTGFYTGGKLLSMSNTMEFLRFPPLNLFQRFRLGGTIFYASKIKNWRRLERLSVEKWLRRWSGKGAFEKVWLPLLKAKLGDAYKQTSAAFIWAHTARMYKARRSGAKKEMFGYVPGGYARILEAWTSQLEKKGVSLLADHPVQSIRRTGETDGQLEVDFGDGRVETYDNVVSTIASPLIAESCDDLSEQEKASLRGIRYLGVVCASMLTKKPISPYYVTNITDTWVPLTAVIEMSTIVDPDDQLGGNHLIYLPKYAADDHSDLRVSDKDYKDRCLETLEKMYDHFDRDDVIDFKVARAKYVAALSTVDYSTRLPSIVTSVPGFYALNSAHILEGNLNVNETITLGEQKIESEVWPDFISRQHGSAAPTKEDACVV
ncbi:MAG: FAD-dependent oxidoreductase, partial [Planctomycetota bacterium]